MKTLLIIPLFLFCLAALGQAGLEFDQCMEDATTTAEMIGCAAHAGEAWDKELNTYYKLYIAELDDANKLVLKEAQRQWIIYRDNEFKLIDTHYYSQLEGTMWHPVAAGEKMKMVKERALKLKSYYEDLEIN